MLVVFAPAVTVPLQVLLTAGVEATCSPLVSVSANAIPLSALVLVAGLVIVKITVVVPFSGVVEAPKALLIVGGATILSVAVLLVAPVPPSVAVIAPVVLAASPSTVPVTLTLSVQEALCATLPPDRLMTPVPAVAVGVPLQVFDTLGTAATTSVPVVLGSVSLKATPVRSPAAVVFGFEIVKVNVLVPFLGMLVGLKALLIVGGATTVIFAVLVLPVPAVVSLALTLLLAVPATVPFTFTVIVHEAPAARLAPVKLIVPEPAVAVGVVLHVFVKPLGVATTSVPGAAFGKVSVKEIPFRVETALLLGFVIVSVRLVVPFRGMVEAPKTLFMVGGLMTFRLADAVFPLPASLEFMVTLFGFTPSEVPVTSTLTVQGLPLTGKAAFAKLMLVAPALAVTLPPQPFTTFGVAATTKPLTVPPEVRSSAKLESIVVTFGLVIEKVIVLVPPTLIIAGLKLLAIDGGCSTIMLAVTLALST